MCEPLEVSADEVQRKDWITSFLQGVKVMNKLDAVYAAKFALLNADYIAKRSALAADYRAKI